MTAPVAGGPPVPPRGVRIGPSRRGVRIGVDVGSVRVGIARSDPDGKVALPVVTLRRDRSGDRDIEELAGLVADYDVTAVVVGLPRTLAGREGPAAVAVREYAGRVEARIAPVPVHFADERLTTVDASRGLSRRGVSTRRQRAMVDQAAAVLILQAWLDQTRNPATPAAPTAGRVDGGPTGE